MNYSTHRSAVLLSAVILCLLSATAVFADGPEPKPTREYPPKYTSPTPTPTATPTPTPTPTPTVTPKPSVSPYPGGGGQNPVPPKPSWWWWISAAILLLLLLFVLFWILRRRKPTGYATPPSNPSGPTYPPVDQSPGQTPRGQY